MSGGLDGIVHIWDLRSGRSIVTLQNIWREYIV